jgi:hypothetical protein
VKLIPTTKDAIALICVTLLALGLFISGLFDVLDYVIVKAMLFLGFGALFVAALIFAFKNESKKNRPEDELQDDLH